MESLQSPNKSFKVVWYTCKWWNTVNDSCGGWFNKHYWSIEWWVLVTQHTLYSTCDREVCDYIAIQDYHFVWNEYVLFNSPLAWNMHYKTTEHGNLEPIWQHKITTFYSMKNFTLCCIIIFTSKAYNSAWVGFVPWSYSTSKADSRHISNGVLTFFLSELFVQTYCSVQAHTISCCCCRWSLSK